MSFLEECITAISSREVSTRGYFCYAIISINKLLE
jgi:hypothetical protein